MKTDFAAVCICDKLCTSKAGLTLHQKRCKLAQEAVRKGSSAIQTTNIFESSDFGLVEPASIFYNLAKDITLDINIALKEHNKSACTRARVNLNLLRRSIVPLRKLIFDSIRKHKFGG